MQSDAVLQVRVSHKLQVICIYIFLVVSTVAVYLQIRNHEFISFDDPTYVTDNAHVKAGLTIDTLKWAFSLDNISKTYWHPLTWLSHMMDTEIFGLDAGKHHLVNLLFHVLNILLLFFLLNKMTGSLWKSALTAAFFGLHPINVDSVAWLAERKTVLSTFFWMLTMLAYYYYVRNKGIARYVVVVSFFAMGLLSKPMVVTLPFVLLLLDYWPLSRISHNKHQDSSIRKDVGIIHNREACTARPLQLILEKIPLFVLALLTIFLSSHSLQQAQKFDQITQPSFILRIENAIVSYFTYFLKMIWPLDLTFYYPYPTAIPSWKVLLVLAALLAVTIAALRLAHKAPYLLVGWLWYIVTLIPVLGLIQGGLWPEIADRWAYIPFIGLFIIFAWGVPALLSSWRFHQIFLVTTSGLLIVLLMIQTGMQVGYWQNNKTLYTHALKINPENFIALNNLGQDYFNKGDYGRALLCFQDSVKASSAFVLGQTNIARTLQKMGRKAEATSILQKVIQVDPMNYDAYYYLANIFYADKEFNKSKELFSKALIINPSLYMAHLGLGNVLSAMGNQKEAYSHLQEAIMINPYFAQGYYGLGLLEDSQGRPVLASGYYMKTLQIDESFVPAHLRLGIYYMKLNKRKDAVMHFKKAARIQPDNIDARKLLGNALIGENDFVGALDNLCEVLRKDSDQFQTQLAVGILFLKIGKIDKAIKHLNKAREITPSSEEVRRNLDKAELIMEAGNKAIRNAEEGIKADPRNISLYMKLGDLYAGKGDVNTAQDNYLKALSLDDKSPLVLTKLAIINSDMGAYDRAILYLKKIVELVPDHVEAYYNISCIYAKQKKGDLSILWLKKAVSMGFHDWDLMRNDWDLENIRYTKAYEDLMRDKM